MGSLEDQLNSGYAESWRPEPGDMLIGEVMSITSRTTEYGAYRILEIKRDDGTRLAVHAFHQVLEQELAKIKPQIGHRIGIKFLGKPEGKNYVSYKAATENAPAEDWSDAAQEPPASDVPNDFPPVTQSVPSGTKTADDDDIPF